MSKSNNKKGPMSKETFTPPKVLKEAEKFNQSRKEKPPLLTEKDIDRLMEAFTPENLKIVPGKYSAESLGISKEDIRKWKEELGALVEKGVSDRKEALIKTSQSLKEKKEEWGLHFPLEDINIVSKTDKERSFGLSYNNEKGKKKLELLYRIKETDPQVNSRLIEELLNSKLVVKFACIHPEKFEREILASSIRELNRTMTIKSKEGKATKEELDRLVKNRIRIVEEKIKELMKSTA